MDVLAVNPLLKADPPLEMTQRLQEVLNNYLRYHRIGGSTQSTIKFYAKELRLFLQDLEPVFQTLGGLTAEHVLKHLGSMKERGLKPRSIRTRNLAGKPILSRSPIFERRISIV